MGQPRRGGLRVRPVRGPGGRISKTTLPGPTMDIPLQFYPRNPAAPVADACTADPIVGNRVELQLLTTLKCNLKCSYCSLGVGDVLGSQIHVEYSMEQLVAFAE
jgi:hypothetical protein